MPGDVVVVGAGLAGWRTASTLRSTGFPGSITLVGDEVHPPYDRPPLSKGVLSGSSTPASTLLADTARLAELNIAWRGGVRATALDAGQRAVALSDGSHLGFDRLVIATGAVPRTLPGAQALRGVHVLRTLEDSLAMREAARTATSVVVLGGGVLGCEIAATLSGAVPTTIVEAAPSLLARAFGQSKVGDALARMHRAAGVRIILGTRVERLLGDSSVTGVLCDDGSVLEADLVVVALGVLPGTQWLDRSGVDCDDGVLCDSYLRTSVEGVFAAGDVARKVTGPGVPAERLEHWTSATEQAQVVAHNLSARDGQELMVHDALPYVWSDQHGRKLQILGRPGRAGVEHVAFDDVDNHRMLALFSDDGYLSAAAALGLPKYVVKLRRLIEDRFTLPDALATVAGWLG